jgi:methylisocitrate lyase
MAGVAAAHIEDQIYPKRAHYHKLKEHIIPAEDMVAKLKVAAAARRDKDFIIIGRTDGFAEGVRRANLYLEAGVDMIYVFPNNKEEARQAPKEIAGPLLYPNSDGHRSGRPCFSIKELEDMGYKMVAYPASSILVAAKAVKEMLETLKETGRTGVDQAEMLEIRKYNEDSIGLEEMY